MTDRLLSLLKNIRLQSQGWINSSLTWKLLLITVVLFVVYIAFQVWQIHEQIADQVVETQPLVTGGHAGNLHVTYPQRLHWLSQDAAPQPLVIWSAPPITTVAHPTSTITYSISLAAQHHAVVFTDKEGLPTAPHLTLTPPGEATIYLRRNSITATTPIIVQLTVSQVETATNQLRPIGRLPVTLQVRQSGSAYLYHILQHIFATIFSVPAAILALGGLLWQQWQEAERKRAAEQKAQEDAAVQIQRAYDLLASDLPQAVTLWSRYHSELDPIWQAAAIQTKLQQLRLAVITQERWQERLFQSCTDATSLSTVAQQIIALNSDSSLVGVQAARIVRRDVARPSVPVGRPDEVVKALIWLHQLCGSVAEDQITAELVSLVQKPNTAKSLLPLMTYVGVRKLVGVQAVRQALEIVQSTASDEDQRIYQKLITFATEPHDWPPLWVASRPAPNVSVAHSLRDLGLDQNPFGPLQAELDRCLPDFGLPDERVKGAQPTIVFGAPGAGKTSSALLLAHACANPLADPSEPGAFPVYVPFHALRLDATEAAPGGMIALVQQIGFQLIRFWARNPEEFWSLEPADQTASAVVLLVSARTRNGLLRQLRQEGLVDSEAMEKFARLVDQQVAAHTMAELDEHHWLEILARARPKNCSITYLLIDMHDSDLAQRPRQALLANIRQLFAHIVPLATIGVYLKFFIPEALQPRLVNAIPAGVAVHSLQWPAERLETMLAQRLKWVGRSALNEIFASIAYPATLSKTLLQAANGSPRRLVQLGNALLDHWANHKAFAPGELESILNGLP